MPKRTNIFQKVVFLLQKQLLDKAIVTESKLLKSKTTGDDVEIDIVIESYVGEIPIMIGIECTASSRLVDIEWINQMIGKHNDLPINKTILVSKNGFTKNAQKKAIFNNIDVFSLKQAKELSWTKYIQDFTHLVLASFKFRLKSVNMNCERLFESTPDILIHPNLQIIMTPGTEPIRFEDYCNGFKGDSEVGKDVMQHWRRLPEDKRKSEFEFKLTIHFKPPTQPYVQNENKPEYRITALELDMSASIKTTPVELTTAQYLQRPVAYGSAENIFSISKNPNEKVIITIMQKSEETSIGSLLVQKYENNEDRIFDMHLVQKSKA